METTKVAEDILAHEGHCLTSKSLTPLLTLSVSEASKRLAHFTLTIIGRLSLWVKNDPLTIKLQPKYLQLKNWAKGIYLHLQEYYALQSICQGIEGYSRATSKIHHWVRPYEDTKDLFWRTKLDEQTALHNAEIHQLREKLREFQEYAKEIDDAKKKFSPNGKYHSILRIWEKDLDAIFTVAGRLVK